MQIGIGDLLESVYTFLGFPAYIRLIVTVVAIYGVACRRDPR